MEKKNLWRSTFIKECCLCIGRRSKQYLSLCVGDKKKRRSLFEFSVIHVVFGKKKYVEGQEEDNDYVEKHLAGPLKNLEGE